MAPYSVCEERSPGAGEFICTRRQGHEGVHIATFGFADAEGVGARGEQCCPAWGGGLPAPAEPAPARSPIKLTELPPELSVVDYPQTATRTHVMLVGAGGVGARLAPLLVKHLIPGDALSIVDHDLVEMKNLQRQHFVVEDVGRAKAEVVAERALRAAPQPGVFIHGYQLKVEQPSALSALDPYISGDLAAWRIPPAINGQRPFYRLLVLSAIDSRSGRRAVRDAVDALRSADLPVTWIDCGNDMFNGQALVGFFRGDLHIREVGKVRYQKPCEFHGWAALAPKFLDTPDEVDTADPCALRVDTQTVMANMWAAVAAGTLAVPFITGAPITSLGISFSIRSGGTKVVGVRRVVAPLTYTYSPTTIEAQGTLLA